MRTYHQIIHFSTRANQWLTCIIVKLVEKLLRERMI